MAGLSLRLCSIWNPYPVPFGSSLFATIPTPLFCITVSALSAALHLARIPFVGSRGERGSPRKFILHGMSEDEDSPDTQRHLMADLFPPGFLDPFSGSLVHLSFSHDGL